MQLTMAARSRAIRRLVCLSLTAAALLPARAAVSASSNMVQHWTTDWAVEKDFLLEVDTAGYELPTAIAFVPEPGHGPEDPLYFVAELRGRLKVVTNDRRVRVFAEPVFSAQTRAELPDPQGETGMAGLCLDATLGYVFVTYAYRDAEGLLRNAVTRFESVPGVFSLHPTGRLDLATDILSSDKSAVAHQIGPCQVDGDSLFVGVGDGTNHVLSRSLASTLGKILRLTLDGTPHPANPFLQPGMRTTAASYVWAYGFRNPFSLKRVHGRTFVADNGAGLDRFLEVHAGEDYLWNGTEWSISTRANTVFSPSVGPVQMDYGPPDPDLFPERYDDRFYIATVGKTAETGTRSQGAKSVVMLEFDFDRDRVTDVPKTVVAYRGTRHQGIAALAFGPDGLYFAPLFPHADGGTYVLKLTYNPERAHPYVLGDEAPHLMSKFGCLGCHQLDGVGNTVAPSLDADVLVARLRSKLDSEAYLAVLRRLEQREPALTSAAAAAEILGYSGMERVRAWITQYLLNPRFDGSASSMPALPLSKAEAAAIAEYLAPDPPSALRARAKSIVVTVIGPLGYGKFSLAVLAAFTVGALSGLILQVLVSRGRHRRRASAAARNA